MKKILLSLFVGFVGIISFCSADYILSGSYDISMVGGNVSNLQLPNDIVGVYINSTTCTYHTAECPVTDNTQTIPYNSTIDQSLFNSNILNCSNKYFTIWVKSLNCTTNVSFIYDVQGDSCDYSDYVPLSDYNNLLSDYNNLSGQFIILQNNYNSCQSSLSGVQSDLSSCQSFTNGFNEQLNYCNSELVSCNSSLTSCLQYNCPETELSYSKFYVKHGESSWSQLSGTEFYYVYLPEYLGFNFDYSNNGRDLDFTVGVATDTGYINNINAIQNSKPSQGDLNKLVSEVLPLFVPGLAVILLLYFIFRFIKKVF